MSKLDLDRLLDNKIKYRLYRNDWIVVKDQSLSIDLINEFNRCTGFNKIHFLRCSISVDNKNMNSGVIGIFFHMGNEHLKFSHATFTGVKYE